MSSPLEMTKRKQEPEPSLGWLSGTCFPGCTSSTPLPCSLLANSPSCAWSKLTYNSIYNVYHPGSMVSLFLERILHQLPGSLSSGQVACQL